MITALAGPSNYPLTMKRVYVDPTTHLERAARADFASLEWHELALLAHRLRRDGPQGELLCLSALPPYLPPAAHQIEAAVTAIETMGGRALLADDEALDPIGTAALIAREWVVRGLARILVLARPSRMSLYRDALGALVVGNVATVTIAPIADASILTGRGWDALIVDGAHILSGDLAAAAAVAAGPRRLLLVSSTPIRSDDRELESLLALLGGAAVDRHVIRRLAPVCQHSRLAEIVRLEGSPAERLLVGEAREKAIEALALSDELGEAWCGLLKAAEALPAALPRAAAAVLDIDRQALGRAHVLAVLRTAQAAAVRTPSKFEALVPLVSASAGRTLVCIATPEGASWLRLALAGRGHEDKVKVLADGESLRADPAAFRTLVHADTPWDPRGVAARLARLAASPELRVFHLVLAGSVEDELVSSYQDALALASPPGEVAAVVAEASADPEAILRKILPSGDFGAWTDTLKGLRAAACRAFVATSSALDP